MSMFTIKSKTPDPAPERYPLPAGHDDASGPFYVPDSLRETWAECAAEAASGDYSLLSRTMRVLALHRWRHAHYPEAFQPRVEGQVVTETHWNPRVSAGPKSSRIAVTVPARYPLHMLQAAAEIVLSGHELAQDIGMMQEGAPAWVEQYLSEHSEELKQEAEHSIRLHHVMNTQNDRNAKESRDELTRRRFLCKVCGVSDESHGQPVSRLLAPQSKARIVSCLPCYFVAIARLATRAEQQQLGSFPHMRTRAQVIDAFLNEKGL